jgi:uncharacterized membrane protein
MRRLSCTLFIVALTLVNAHRAEAQLELCNHTTVGINSVVVYIENGAWYAAGWYRADPNECTVVRSEIDNRYYYVHGEEINGSRQWGDGNSWCVNPTDAFTIPTNRPCQQNEQLRGFSTIDTGDNDEFEFDYSCSDCAPPPPEKPQWQKDLDWSISNSDAGGSTDCPLDYPYPECVISGGRACLMRHAKQSAHDHDCANALRVALVTQCHNRGAANGIAAAGESQVCQYLGPPDPVVSAPPPPTPPAVGGSGSPHPIAFTNQSGMVLYIYYFVSKGGTVDCRNYSNGGNMPPQGRAAFTVPAGYTAHFVFQKSPDPCPVSTIRSEVNIPGGNPNPQTMSVQ